MHEYETLALAQFSPMEGKAGLIVLTVQMSERTAVEAEDSSPIRSVDFMLDARVLHMSNKVVLALRLMLGRAVEVAPREVEVAEAEAAAEELSAARWAAAAARKAATETMLGKVKEKVKKGRRKKGKRGDEKKVEKKRG